MATSGNCSEKLESVEGLTKLREFMRGEIKDKGLRCPVDDEFLLRFLRSKIGDPVAAFKVVRAYYKLRGSQPIPNFLEKLHPSACIREFESDMFTVLKNRDSLGRLILIFKTRKWDVQIFSLDDVILAFYLILEELISYEESQKNGIVLIADHGGLSYRTMTTIGSQFSIKKIKMLIGCYQGAFPARFKGLHVVNQPHVFTLIFKLAMPFMSDKLRNRVHPHGRSHKNLFDYEMSPDILPESIGGKIPDSECCDEEFMQRFFANNDFYKEMSKNGYPNEN